MAVKFLSDVTINGSTTAEEITVTGTTNLNGTNFISNYFYHSGDGDTYFGFPSANTFKVNET